MTPKQEKYLTEKYIRPMVKKMLREEFSTKTFTIYKRQVNPNGLVEIESYNIQEAADAVCKVLNKYAPNMKGDRNKSGQDYIVKSE